MSKGLTIPLSLDPRDWISGIKVVERTLDDMGDELENVEDAGERLESQLRDTFRDVADAADRAGDEIGEDLPDAMTDARRAGDRLERSFEANMRDVDRAADRAGDGMDELTDEVGSSAREFGSAFRGDPVEALEEVQSLASELSSKLIPGIGGAVLSVAGGVAFSALIGFYERWREEQEAINERVRGYRDAVLDAFGVLEKSAVTDALTTQLDEAGITFTEFEAILQRAPEHLRVGFRQALQAGDLKALEALMVDIDASAAAINDKVNTGGTYFNDQERAVVELNNALGGTVGELADGVEQAQAAARIIGNDVTDAADDVGDSISDWQDPLGATIDRVRAIEGDLDEVDVAALGLSRGALRDLRDRLREADEAAGSIKSNVLGVPKDVKVNVELSARVRGANARAQSLLDRGVFD